MPVTFAADPHVSPPVLADVSRWLPAMMYVAIALAVALVCLMLVSGLRDRLRDRRALRERARWGEREYAEARTHLLSDVHRAANGQLHDVRKRDLMRISDLGDHLNAVLTLAMRAGFVEEHPLRAGIAGHLAAFAFRDDKFKCEPYVRFTERGLQTFIAALQG